MKLSKEEKKAIVDEIVARINAKDNEKYNDLYSRYVYSERYLKAEILLNGIKDAVDSLLGMNVNLPYPLYNNIPESYINSVLDGIKKEDIDFKPSDIDIDKIERLLVLSNISKGDFDAESFISEIMNTL